MAKKAKKRGVKPGTRRGRYNKIISVDDPRIDALAQLTPYEQLDTILTQLENRILNTVARIKSLGI